MQAYGEWLPPGIEAISVCVADWLELTVRI